MTVASPLESAFAKLQWADVHINNLIDVIEVGEHVETRPVTSQDRLPYPYKHLRRILLPNVPESIAFIVADAIHNTRVVLDYLMSNLASRAGQ